MPSPFSGMNPYFEQPGLWRGFHTAFIVNVMNALSPRIAPQYHVEIEESRFIAYPTSESADHPYIVGESLAPISTTIPLGRYRKHRWLTIRDTQNREVVTVLEVLSPTNKTSADDRAHYLRQRRRMLRGNAHLVEIDLLRGGDPMPMNGVPDSDYRILVARRGKRPNVDVWPFDLRDPIPEIPIPLAGDDPDVWLDLKPTLDAVYDGGAYRYRLYDHPPDPPLTGEDQAWAAGLVKVG
jgi:hypothetical protein